MTSGPTRPAEPIITLIAAVSRNGTIGADGGLPWHLPADLKRFKALTMGHSMIMGRRTYDSIGRALPGRRTIVVTRDPQWAAPGVTVAHSVDDAIDLALSASDDLSPGSSGRPVLVVGGGDIYRQTIGRASRLEVTHVDVDVVGDTRFPDIDPAVWQVADRREADGYAFVSYRRRPIRDLRVLLASMAPVLHDDEFAFCAIPSGTAMPEGLTPVATVMEAEGTTLVLTAAAARSAGLTGEFACRWITLMVPSALDAVGLTAAVAAALTGEGIACNVIAGFHHDHLFVPVDAATRAMATLAALSRSHE